MLALGGARAVLRHPLAAPIAAGAALRLIAALAGYGPFASDDYLYALEPAWRSIHSPDLPPASPIRSTLLPDVLGWIFRAAHRAGVDDPTWLVRVAYLALGLYSLLAIPAVYFLVRDRFDARAARTAAWLMAASALMPRISTRALIEVAAVPPLVWGMWLAARGGQRAALGAGLLLGAACMVRFQLGIAAVAVVAVLGLRGARREAALCAMGGLVMAGVQALYDLGSHGEVLAAPLRYVAMNVEHSSSFGRAPWYSYAAIWIALTVPPATVALARPLVAAARRAPLVTWPLVVFVVVHSAIPHKEERFMFSVVPLFFALLAPALQEARAASPWGRRAVAWFWIVNALALVVATLSDGQQALTRPLREASRTPGLTEVVAVGRPAPPALYAGAVPVRHVAKASELAAALVQRPAHGRVRFVLARAADAAVVTQLGFACGAPEAAHGDLADRLVVWINPEMNRRRAARTVLDCSAPARE